MKRSALKRKAKRTKQQEYITRYKKQQNLVVKLNKKTKLFYFDYLETPKNSKPFWDNVDLIFLTNMPAVILR